MVRVKIAAVFVVICALVRGSSAIECYVCRGCATVTDSDVQTCPAVTTTDAPETTTDHDGSFDQVAGRKAENAPWLGDDDAHLIEEEGFVVDRSALVPERFSSRSLKEVDDGSRCVVAVYQENGATNVVRECSTASTDQEARCREAVSDNFDGPLTYCLLCDGDLCNSAPKAAVAAIVLALGLFLNLA